MKEIIIKNIDETIFYEKINDLDIYFYNTDKTKNFYVSLTVKYGGSILKYKKNNKKSYNIIPGSAHFLEHKIMNYTSSPNAYELINSVGSLANAFTDYLCTNYNVFGSERIIDNIKLILDLVFYPKITSNNVENEKGIINEEIDMNLDDPIVNIYEAIFNNLFEKSFLKTPILGTKNSIKNITEKSLMKIYNDFYNPSNMFLCISGKINIDEIKKFITLYMTNIKAHKNNIKIVKEKEDYNIVVNYSQIKSNNTTPKVSIGIKTRKNIFNFVNDLELNYYILLILSSYFDNSKNIEKYKKEGLIIGISYEVTFTHNNIIIIINCSTNESEKYIKRIKKDLFLFKITKEDFDRKKKVMINNLIMGFENIEEVDYFINRQILLYKKINKDLYNVIKKLDYKICKTVEKKIDFNNITIVKQSK